PFPDWVKSHHKGRSLTSEADSLMLANHIQQLRQESLQKGKSGHVSKVALARALGISKRTFLRRKAYVEFYNKNYKKPCQTSEMTDQEAQQKGFTEEQLNSAKNSFQLKKEEVLIRCATCGRMLKINQSCPDCRACQRCGQLLRVGQPC